MKKTIVLILIAVACVFLAGGIWVYSKQNAQKEPEDVAGVYEMVYGLNPGARFDEVMTGDLWKDSAFYGYLKFSDDTYMYYVHPEKKYVANIIMVAEKLDSKEHINEKIEDLALADYKKYNPNIVADLSVSKPVNTSFGTMVEITEQVDKVAIGAYASFNYDANHNLFSATIVPCFEAPEIDKTKMISEEMAFQKAVAAIGEKYPDVKITQTWDNVEMVKKALQGHVFYQFSITEKNVIGDSMDGFFEIRVDVYTGEVLELSSNLS